MTEKTIDVVPINLPPGARLESNSVVDTKDPNYLVEDLVMVSLSNYSIDVSWKPELDPEGCYAVTVFRTNCWEDQWDRRTTRSATEAAKMVGDLASFVSEYESRELQKKKFMESAPTRQLLGWLEYARRNGDSYFEYRYGFDFPTSQIKAVLATREHVPNKQEAKAIRREKANQGGKGRKDR